MVRKSRGTTLSPDPYAMARVLDSVTTESGRRFIDLVDESAILLVFLRHSGCTFCREALADIAEARTRIEDRGVRIILVHLGDREGIERLAVDHGLDDVERICDSAQTLYHAFGLRRGSFSQLLGFKVWFRAFTAGVMQRHGFGRPRADFRQMPGVFYIEQGQIAKHFRHRSAADRPRYDAICAP